MTLRVSIAPGMYVCPAIEKLIRELTDKSGAALLWEDERPGPWTATISPWTLGWTLGWTLAWTLEAWTLDSHRGGSRWTLDSHGAWTLDA